jgi:hypothetical protein
MEEFDRQGRLVYSKSGMPSYERYLDEMPGVALQDLWSEIPPIAPQAQERLGYPTQKPAPGPNGKRYCYRCAPRRRVYMHYMLVAEGWRVTFVEENLKTPLRRTLFFATEEKVLDMAMRGGAEWTSADRESMAYGLNRGRGPSG